jgi:hypothetical protein
MFQKVLIFSVSSFFGKTLRGTLIKDANDFYVPFREANGDRNR